MKPIHIFKTGKHIDSHGTEINFSDADLAGAVACYDPKLSQAPIVVGHPKTDKRAFGWITKMTSKNGNLYADHEQVNPEFSEQVKAGAYKKISPSFYPPNSPNNPVKGNYYLRHVGFLGAQPPAVKGLEPVEFSQDDDDFITIELDFSESDSETPLKKMFHAFMHWMGGSDFSELADDATINEPEPKQSINQTTETNLNEGDDMATQAELDAEKARADKLQEQLDARDKADAEAKVKAQEKENADFAESLVQNDKIAPCDKEFVSAILDGLDTADSVKPVEFGEGDDKKSLKQAVKDKLANANTDSFAYLFSEAAGKPKHDAKDSYDFGEQADPDSVSADSEVRAYMQANNVSYAVAAKAVLG